MAIYVDFTPIQAKISSDSLILTPNARTLSAVVSGYMMKLEQDKVIISPNALTFSGWLEALFSELSFLMPIPKLIGSLELKSWLKDKISSDSRFALTNALGVAEKVLEAYRTLNQWHTHIDEIEEFPTFENQCLKEWVESLEAYLNQHQLLPQFSLPNFLYEQRNRLQQYFPKHIAMVGFNQLTPAEQRLIDFLVKSGTNTDFIYPTVDPESYVKVECDDFSDEVETAAQYVQMLSEQKPLANIGVVVNQLANHIDLVHEKFSQTFQSDEQLPWKRLSKMQYNVSAGQPLIQLPAANIALKLLQLSSQSISRDLLRLIKNSPFLLAESHAKSIRAFLHDQYLLGYQKYSVDRLIKEAEAVIANDYTFNNVNKNSSVQSITKSPMHASYDVPIKQSHGLTLFCQLLRALQSAPSQPRPMSAWIEHWKGLLESWLWCAEDKLAESTSLLKIQFMEALKESVNLSFINAKPTKIEALEYLQQILKQKTFQLPSDRTNIHILGVLEAAGLTFDELVLIGFSKDNWPMKAQPNPFLPMAFQQNYNTPGASPEKEFSYAADLSKTLLSSAKNICLTYSKTEDEAVTGESALFSHLRAKQKDDLGIVKQVTSLATNYQWRVDEHIRLPLDEIKGGAYMLSNYASCPFKGMSLSHFGVRPVENIENGVDAKLRGAWLHRALELIWCSLKDSDALHALTDAEQIELVKSSLIQSQREYQTKLFASASPLIIQLEFEKLFEQINTWLDIDRMGGKYSVSTEVDKELDLAGIKLKFKIDRIDQRDDGRINILDYKTGHVDVSKWFGERPDEAQMPAYALACADEKIASISYAKLKTGEIENTGIWCKHLLFDVNAKSDETNTVAKQSVEYLSISPNETKNKTKYFKYKDALNDEEALKAYWRENLENLSKYIQSGLMVVSPKNKNTSCRYCDFSDFCRINEIQPSEMKRNTVTKSGKQHLFSVVNLNNEGRLDE